MIPDFRRSFWRPPRAHGEVIEDRTVSFLELFYDLVYVVVVGRAAHHLAGHVDWRGVGDFAVIFGLIWIAWVNGTLYYELHGREDGRTRVFVFVQMLILVLLSVYTEDAAGAGGRGFGIVYILFLAVLTWLWYSVRRRDEEQYMAATARYLYGMAISMIVVAASLFLTDSTRMIVWAGLVVFWAVGVHVMARLTGTQSGLVVTESLVERFGLFVIIVLGEVVVGVAAGLAEAERNAEIIATGLLGLSVGFAYWWTYFDFVGRRLPEDSASVRMRWLTAHLPITMSVAAAGAAMVSLIEHGDEAATPASTAWLLTGSMALGLVALVIQVQTLGDFREHADLFRPVVNSMLGCAGLILLYGWWAPVPWLLAALTVVSLAGLWLFAIGRWYRSKTLDVESPGAGSG